jgi:hypothetical protein
MALLTAVASVGLSVAGLPSPVAAAAKKADLKVAAPTGVAASLTPGGRVSATATVTSIAPVKKTTTSFTLSSDGTVGPGDVILAQVATTLKAAKGKRLGKSKPKAIVTLAGTVPAGTSPGSYSLIACADAAGKVKEKSEKNNCAAAPVTIAKPAPTAPVGPTGPVDTTPPAAPSIGTITPGSPSNNPAPTVTLTGEPGARVDVYRQAACTGPVGASITLPAGGTAGLPVAVNHNTTTTLTAKSVDAAGNASPCSTSKSYIHDDVAPAAATVGIPSPFLTGRDAGAVYRGTAEAGSTVEAHSNTFHCNSSPDATASAASFASPGFYLEEGGIFGVTFQVRDAAGNTSECVSQNRGRTYYQSVNDVTETASPNDGTGTAQLLDVDAYGDDPTSVFGTLGAQVSGDAADYYRIDVGYSGYSLLAEARIRSDACSATKDPKLFLYDASGVQIATADDLVPGSNLCARFDGVSTRTHTVGNVALPAGTYYVAVRSLGTSGFDYELALDTTSNATSETEPNQSGAQANTLVAPYDSAIGVTGGTEAFADYYAFTATGSTVTLNVLAPQGGGQPTCTGADAGRVDSEVTLFAANGTTQLGYNDDVGGGPYNYCSRLTYGSLVAGQRYVVRVGRSVAATPASASAFGYVLTLRP